jgi:predicted house-cleaning noncanonical NTP pyrophosphatase (MazG superfamily)
LTIKTYNKLVRSRIPEIIKARGNAPTLRKLKSGEEIEQKFQEKLQEELDELIAAKSKDEVIEEAADLSQVILDYLRFNGFSDMDLETVRHAKSIKCGTFHDFRVDSTYTFLESVENK